MRLHGWVATTIHGNLNHANLNQLKFKPRIPPFSPLPSLDTLQVQRMAAPQHHAGKAATKKIKQERSPKHTYNIETHAHAILKEPHVYNTKSNPTITIPPLLSEHPTDHILPIYLVTGHLHPIGARTCQLSHHSQLHPTTLYFTLYL